MKGGVISAMLAASAVLAVFLISGRTLAANPSTLADGSPSTQSVAYFYGAYASDGSPPNRDYLDPRMWWDAGRPGAGLSSRKRLAKDKVSKRCRGSPSGICQGHGRPAAVHVSGVRPLVSGGISTPRRFVSKLQGDRADSAPTFRGTSIPSAATGAKSAISQISEVGSDSAVLSTGTNQFSSSAAVRIANVTVLGLGTIAMPLQNSRRGDQHLSFGAGEVDISDDPAPGPYAMLFVGISLLAFIAIRRMEHG